jgi:hypothetical protein
VGHIGRVVLAGLAWNRKKEVHDGLGRGYGLQAELGTRFQIFLSEFESSFEFKKIKGFKIFLIRSLN